MPKENSTAKTGSNTILILEDDVKFRQLIGSAFEAEGYEVKLANDANDAFALLDYIDPAVAIVDYRLPGGMDGLTFIERLREQKMEFPVVLCTGVWIDAKTFATVRNILRVSAVIQKPVLPEVMVHTIQNMLHAPTDMRPSPGVTKVPGMKYPEIAEAVQSGKSVEEMLEAMDAAIQAETDAEKRADLEGLRKRTAGQQKLNEARRSYVASLDQIYREFIAKIATARIGEDAARWTAAREEAHKLRGSAGSYGITELSTVCGRMEELLASYDPDSVMMHELLLSEIDQLIMQGRGIVDRAARELGAVDKDAERVWTVLVVSQPDSDAVKTLRAIVAKNHGLEIDVAESVGVAQAKAKAMRYDGVVIDVSLEASEYSFGIAKELRQIPGYLRMPFGFIGVSDPTAGALIWGGCSVAVRRSDDTVGVTEMVVALTKAAEALKQRILCIDDDPAVTSFVDATLSDAGFAVKTLNEPIQTLEVAKQFGPDAIVLDVMMPGISGFDVCRGLKTHETSAHAPVLFLTASYDTASRTLAYKAGGEDFIAKPVIREELIARLRTYVPPIPDRLGAGGAALLDRLLFMDTVNQFISMPDATGTVLLIAVDDAEEMGEKYGALAPEIVSTILARLISIRFRPQDLRTQLDRDRFSVFLPDTTSIQEREVVEAIKREIDTLYFPSGTGDKFTPDIRISASPITKPVKAGS